MSDIDYDNPAIEEQWCNARREQIVSYLDEQSISHGQVGEWPAWHVAPYVSIWAIESKENPGWVGWWVICGDLPTDYVSAEQIKHPREALKAIAHNWNEVSLYMERVESHPTISVGSPDVWHEMAPLLKSRANILNDWADDDNLWVPGE